MRYAYEDASGNSPDVFKPIMYSLQVVAGVNYFIKVHPRIKHSMCM